MLYNRCTGIYKFGNNTYPRRIRRRSNLGHIFRGKKCVLWAGKYGSLFGYIMPLLQITRAKEIQEICSGIYRTAAHLCAQEKSNLLPRPTSCVSRHGEII